MEFVIIVGGISWTWHKIAEYMGIKPIVHEKNEYGFKRFCESLGIKYISFNKSTNEGFGLAEEGGMKITYRFKYSAQLNSFESDEVTNVLKMTPVPEDKETEIINDNFQKILNENEDEVQNEYIRLMDSIANSNLSPELENKAKNENITKIKTSDD